MKNKNNELTRDESSHESQENNNPSTNFDLDFLNQSLNTNSNSINDSDIQKNIVEDEKIIDKRKSYNKLSMEEKFKTARRQKWFKSIRWRITLIYAFPVNKKTRLKQQKQFFIRRFNEFFGTNYRIDTVGTDFDFQYRRYVDSKGFIWAVRIYIAIVAIIVLPIALYFIISRS